MKTQNKIVWVDIPVENLERACKFYGDLMGLKFTVEGQGDMKFGLCPHTDHESAFCLVPEENFIPSQSGPMIYLNVDGRMDKALETVSKNGGKILAPKSQICSYGFRAIIIDSEGNRTALHSLS